MWELFDMCLQDLLSSTDYAGGVSLLTQLHWGTQVSCSISSKDLTYGGSLVLIDNWLPKVFWPYYMENHLLHSVDLTHQFIE